MLAHRVAVRKKVNSNMMTHMNDPILPELTIRLENDIAAAMPALYDLLIEHDVRPRAVDAEVSQIGAKSFDLGTAIGIVGLSFAAIQTVVSVSQLWAQNNDYNLYILIDGKLVKAGSLHPSDVGRMIINASSPTIFVTKAQ